MAVQIRGGVILPLPSSRHRVAVGEPEAVILQPQDRVIIEHQRPHDRLPLSVDIVIVLPRRVSETDRSVPCVWRAWTFYLGLP